MTAIATLLAVKNVMQSKQRQTRLLDTLQQRAGTLTSNYTWGSM